MTLGDINLKVYNLTHTDINSYHDASMLVDVNIVYQRFASIVLEAQDDTDFDDPRNVNYPIATRLLVAGQRDYSFATTSWSLQGREGGAATASQALLPLKIRRVDVTYDGTNYYRATPFDDGVSMWGKGNVTNEDINMIKQAPRYTIDSGSINIYPLAIASDVSAGALVRLEFERNVVPFSQTADYAASTMSTSTSVPGFDATFHPFIAWGTAFEFAIAQNLPQQEAFKKMVDEYEQRIRTAYGRKNLDTVLSLRPAYDSFGDFGSTDAGGYSYGR